MAKGKPGGYAHIFCSAGPAGAGHIAWGFAIDYLTTKPGHIAYKYCFGSYDNSTENSHGEKVWMDTGTGRDMLECFKLDGYDRWKFIYVPYGIVGASPAQYKARSWLKRHYSIVGQNCLDMVHDVLTAYGTPCLPTKWPINWLPRRYFDDFQGQTGVIQPNA